MPTVAVSPSILTHSWSSVYLTVMGFSRGLVKGAGVRGNKGLNADSATVVAVGHKRHGRYLHGHRLAAHNGVHPRADGGKFGAHIAHGHRLVDAGGEQAAADFTNRCAVDAVHRGEVTNGN